MPTSAGLVAGAGQPAPNLCFPPDGSAHELPCQLPLGTKTPPWGRRISLRGEMPEEGLEPPTRGL